MHLQLPQSQPTEPSASAQQSVVIASGDSQGLQKQHIKSVEQDLNVRDTRSFRDLPSPAEQQTNSHPHDEPREQIVQANSSSPRLIVEFSPQVQCSSATSHPQSDENELIGTLADVNAGLTAADQSEDISQAIDIDEISRAVSKVQVSSDASRARPLICQDITNSNADTLRISRLPRGVTYDRLLSMVEPFGDVEDLSWTASDPYVCDVTYRDTSAAREAKHFLGDALVGNNSEPSLKAELRSRDPGAQLFVGDLTPDVTEEMLEEFFSGLVGEPVSALLKRDPDSFSPIGYGFLSFNSESSANFALVAGHRSKIGNACVRVGRAERNTHLYVSDLAPDVTLDEVKNLFSKFGSLVEEDSVIVRRSYAFIRYKNRAAAEKAKRTLDKTDLKGRLSVRYAEAESLKACVAVQFHSSVPRPPNSLRDLLSATFSKHGNCSIEIPRLQNGMWRKVAFVTFHGDPIAANLAALEAVQSIRFVSSLPVCCQFARELIPRLPSRNMRHEKFADIPNRAHSYLGTSERTETKSSFVKKAGLRSTELSGSGISHSSQVQRKVSYSGDQETATPDFVPVYVPISALHPSQLSGNAGHGAEGEYPGYQWQQRVMLANGNNVAHSLNPAASQFTPSYTSFPPLPGRTMRW